MSQPSKNSPTFQDQVDRILESGRTGDLSGRFDVGAADGERKDMLERFNELLDSFEGTAVRATSAMEGSSTANMQVDLDRVITSVNPATVELIRSNLGALKQQFPKVDFENVVGTSIDVFHANPSYQARILADPANLPHRAEIEVAGRKFELNICAMRDERGDYIGASLEWSDITELRERQESAARLVSAVKGSATASIQVTATSSSRASTRRRRGSCGRTCSTSSASSRGSTSRT